MKWICRACRPVEAYRLMQHDTSINESKDACTSGRPGNRSYRNASRVEILVGLATGTCLIYKCTLAQPSR